MFISPGHGWGTLATVASEPKEARFYSAGHELNQQATQQRIAWLRKILKIESANSPTSNSSRTD
jgi:hypothetical protein